jgi:hypothetical protein
VCVSVSVPHTCVVVRCAVQVCCPGRLLFLLAPSLGEKALWVSALSPLLPCVVVQEVGLYAPPPLLTQGEEGAVAVAVAVEGGLYKTDAQGKKWARRCTAQPHGMGPWGGRRVCAVCACMCVSSIVCVSVMVCIRNSVCSSGVLLHGCLYCTSTLTPCVLCVVCCCVLCAVCCVQLCAVCYLL